MIGNFRLAAVVMLFYFALGCDPITPETKTEDPNPSSTPPVPVVPTVPTTAPPPSETRKMLVYCHPHPIKKAGDHFLWNFFSETVAKEGKKMSDFAISSMDILPGGTIQADGFSDDFVQKHLNEYNLVFVPDCGGNWIKYQDPILNLNGIYDLISTVLKVVKPQGKLILSKFVAPNLAKLVAAKFDGTIINTPLWAGLDFVEIVKK